MKASDVFFEEEKLFENGLIKKSFFSPFLDRRILIILFVILVRFKPIRLTRIYTGILESVHCRIYKHWDRYNVPHTLPRKSQKHLLSFLTDTSHRVFTARSKIQRIK